MPKYRAVLFDLFGTVALIDPEKLPLFEWNGQSRRSTTAAVRALYEQEVRDISFAQFFTALTNVAREQVEERARDLREVPCVERFARTLIRAGLTDSASTRGLAEKLALTHNSALSGAIQIPPEHAAFLARASTDYSLALVSNFDHSATARQLLHFADVARHFVHIAISDEHGWRKPDPRIFVDTLAALGAQPEEALFVGDAPHEDIAGAKRVGMDVAWVNPLGACLPEGIPIPDYVIPAIPSLQPVLFD